MNEMKPRVLKRTGSEIITIHKHGAHLSKGNLLPLRVNPANKLTVKEFFENGDDIWCITNTGEQINTNHIL